MADNSISKIYQFLTSFNKENNKDWREVADKNGDGIILKTEFRNFMLINFNDWDGENANKDDLINKFWKSVDTKTSGKISGTKTKDRNALSSDELDKMDAKIQIFEKMNEFVKQNVKASDAGVSDTGKWMKSVKESLGSYIEQYVKNGGTIDGVEEYLAQKLPIVKSMASANLYIQEYLRSAEFKELVPANYKGQGTIQSIIDEFVTSLRDNESFLAMGSDSERLSYIKSKAEQLVKDYLATADLCEGNPENLAEYGYYTGGELNDIQQCVLEDKMGKGIQEYMKEHDPDLCTKANEEAIKAAVDKFIANKLQDATYDDFKTLKNFDASEIEDDEELQELLTQLRDELDELNTAKENLKEYCKGLADRNNEDINDAIKRVFGSSDYASKIDKCKDKEAVDKLEAAIKERISKIDKNADVSNINDISITLKSDETKPLTSLPETLTSATGKLIPTNEISYEVGSGSHLSKSGNKIVAKGSSEGGTFVETVDIYVYGEKVKSVQVEIKIELTAEDAIKNVKNWNNKTSTSLKGVYDMGNDSCDIKDRLTDCSFTDLYNKNAIVNLHISMDSSEKYDDATRAVNSGLSQLGDLIVAALGTTESFDSTILTKAKDNVIPRYQNDLGHLVDDGDGGSEYSCINNMVWWRNEDPNYTSHTVFGARDADGYDSWTWGVNFKDVVDDIIAEYNKLAGK